MWRLDIVCVVHQHESSSDSIKYREIKLLESEFCLGPQPISLSLSIGEGERDSSSAVGFQFPYLSLSECAGERARVLANSGLGREREGAKSTHGGGLSLSSLPFSFAEGGLREGRKPDSRIHGHERRLRLRPGEEQATVEGHARE